MALVPHPFSSDSGFAQTALFLKENTAEKTFSLAFSLASYSFCLDVLSFLIFIYDTWMFVVRQGKGEVNAEQNHLLIRKSCLTSCSVSGNMQLDSHIHVRLSCLVLYGHELCIISRICVHLRAIVAVRSVPPAAWDMVWQWTNLASSSSYFFL